MTPEEKAQRELLVAKNAAVACIVFRGKLITRRFRVGQRVQFLSHLGWHDGTVIQLGYEPDEDTNVPVPFTAYQVECDNGLFATAPIDSNEIIRLLPGEPVVTVPLAFSHSCEVDQEITGGFQRCRLVSFPRERSQNFCRNCKNLFHRKLNFCGSCKAAAYCSKKCQKAHWSEHKPSCQKMRESLSTPAKESGFPVDGHTKEQILASMQTQDCLEMLVDLWTGAGGGMAYGGASMLKNLVASLVQKTMYPNNCSLEVTARQYLEESPMEELTRMFIHENTIRRLVAACLHFSARAPGVAYYCTVMLQQTSLTCHSQCRCFPKRRANRVRSQ